MCAVVEPGTSRDLDATGPHTLCVSSLTWGTPPPPDLGHKSTMVTLRGQPYSCQASPSSNVPSGGPTDRVSGQDRAFRPHQADSGVPPPPALLPRGTETGPLGPLPGPRDALEGGEVPPCVTFRRVVVSGPWTVTRSSLPFAASGRLRPVLLLVSFPRSRSPVPPPPPLGRPAYAQLLSP